MSSFQLVLKRVRRDWRLLIPAAVGVLAAVTLVSAAPMFLRSVERLGYVSAVRTAPDLMLNVVASADFVPVAEPGLTRVEDEVTATLSRHLESAYGGHERSLRTDDFLLDPTPIIQAPKPASALVVGQEDERPAHFINAAEFEKHVRAVAGRLPGDDVSSNLFEFAEKGPVAEAVVSASTASLLNIEIGDTVTLFAGLPRDRVLASASVVGIVEPVDEDDGYWQGRAAAFFGSRVEDVAPGSAAFVITPEAASKLPEQLVAPAGYTYGHAFIATVSGLEGRVSPVDGRAAGDIVVDDGGGPVVEAVLPVPRALPFGIEVGSVLTLTPFIDEPAWVRAKIVGTVERAAPDDVYWQWGPAGLFDLPEIPDQPLPLIVSREALAQAVGAAYPDSLMRSVWYAPFDRSELQAWSPDDAGARLRDLKIDLAEALPGNTSISGMSSLLETVERQRFVASLTLVALAATTTLTLLFFVSLMMSYVVGARRSDVGKLSALGAGRWRILNLYGAEALAVTFGAAVSAPLLAFAAVLAAVMLPLFHPYRGSSPVPVEWVHWSFVGAAGVGALCFCILSLPPLFGAGAGQLSRRFRWVRAPTTLLFQKYHVDTFLLVLGCLFYWEIYSRGDLIAGGLFRDSNVNEILFVAPVLLVLLVGLLFVRLFPLALRFAAGESAALLDVAAVISVAASAALALLDAPQEPGWSILALLGIAAAYWAARAPPSPTPRYAFLAVQAALVAAFVFVSEPFSAPGSRLAPALGLVALVPAQLGFAALAAYARAAPVSVAMAIKQMARNPYPYMLLSLLLVLVTGLATFAATVGTTLAKRDDDVVRYDVGADLRIADIGRYVDLAALKRSYEASPAVERMSAVYRGRALGLPGVGDEFELLAVEANSFSDTSWYRGDFSVRTLAELMESVARREGSGPAPVPSGASGLGIRAKLGPVSPHVLVTVTLRDAAGATTSLDLGELKQREWTTVTAELPQAMQPPVTVTSIRLLPLPGLIGISGSVLVDSLFAVEDGAEVVLDDFAAAARWTPVPASMSLADSTLAVSNDARVGSGSIEYVYGEGSTRAAPGIYDSPSGGPLPVIAHVPAGEEPGLGIGHTFVVDIGGYLVPFVVADTVDYFPTVETRRRSLAVCDLELLLEHLAALGASDHIAPNELFVKLRPGEDAEVGDELKSLAPRLSLVLDRRDPDELRNRTLNGGPLVTAGWRAMSLGALAASAFAAVVGYAAHLLSAARRIRRENDLLQSLGASRRQGAVRLALENLVVVAVGITLGAWAGLLMSELFVPALSPTRAPVPPVVVATDWMVLGAIWAAEALAFAAMLLLFGRRIVRSDSSLDLEEVQ